MIDWSFFSRRICLTTLPTEWALAESEFVRIGLDNVEKYQSVREIGPHQSFSHSERNILLDFYHSDADVLLHLEDDVTFRELAHLSAALSELSHEWDVLYLGANLLCWNRGDEPQPERVSEHLWRVRQAWTTHAIAYRKKCAFEILAKQPSFSEVMFDQYLSTRLSELNAYCVGPMVAWQRAHGSSIWKESDGVTPKLTDYADVFRASGEKLR